MSHDVSEPRSRRALLAAAAGSAAALAASAALPLTAAAQDPNDVVLNINNPALNLTSITQATNGIGAFKATSDTGAAGIVGSNGADTALASDTSFTGVYGWAPGTASAATFGAGVWGDSDDVGVFGSAFYGVRGDGFVGVLGLSEPGGVGVMAVGATPTDVALEVSGKVTFSRSGRATVARRKSSVRVVLAGTTANSRVFAVLHSNRAGRFVRAVVPTTGAFTIYLNTTVTSASYVAWFVIN